MYKTEICLTIKFKDITLECECTFSTVYYGPGFKPHKEDWLESVDTILHHAEDIQELLPDVYINEIWTLCHNEYFK